MLPGVMQSALLSRKRSQSRDYLNFLIGTSPLWSIASKQKPHQSGNRANALAQYITTILGNLQ
ncbi:hypothetical protein QUA73_26805 [Microcoleus sp. K4-C2]